MDREDVEKARVETLLSGVQGMRVRGGELENLEKRACHNEMGKGKNRTL